jgi:hypothetical protein
MGYFKKSEFYIAKHIRVIGIQYGYVRELQYSGSIDLMGHVSSFSEPPLLR